MDPPSSQLIAELSRLGIYRPRDLKRCRSRVRRLARDLPTFDSVWIDALVQIRRLTPFQARTLESAGAEALILGPFLLCERVEGNARFETYRAVHRETGRSILLTRIQITSSTPERSLERFRAFLDQSAGITTPALSIAMGCTADEGTVSVASRWVAGPTLRELLLRRGRFPPEVVAGVALQICEALGLLAARGLAHGDLRLDTVRITPDGQCVLLHTGLLSSLTDGPSIHVGLPAGCYDTVAPERIDSGRPASAASDAYALGCVLWELLAGRPPFPHGDPLAKLAAHQTRSVPNLDSYAPDAPQSLKLLVSSLTARDPIERPTDFRRIAAKLGRHRSARRRVSRFLETFKSSARSNAASHRRRRRTAPATIVAALLLGVVSIALLDAGARSEILAIAGNAPQRLRQEVSALLAPHSESSTADDQTVETSLLPFPDDTVDGTIELQSPGPYAVEEVAAVGSLTIRAAPGVRPVVIVQDAPMRVWAESLVIEGVTFVAAVEDGSSIGSAQSPPAAILEIVAERFATKDCSFHCDHAPVKEATIRWTPLEDSPATERQIVLMQTVFTGPATSLKVSSLPSAIRADNVLKSGDGALLDVAADARQRGREWRIVLQHTTLRRATSLVRWSGAGSRVVPAPVEISLTECVLDLPASEASLFEFGQTPTTPAWQQLVRVTGRASLVRPGTPMACVAGGVDAGPRPIPADRVAIEGLLTSDFEFSGPPDGNPVNHTLTGYHGYGHSEQPPGADARLLPSISPDAYNSMQTSARAPDREALHDTRLPPAEK